jgi:hypothetical protein
VKEKTIMKKIALFIVILFVGLGVRGNAQVMETQWADTLLISFGNITDPRHALGAQDNLPAIFPAQSSQLDIAFMKDSTSTLKTIRKNAVVTIYVMPDESVDSTGGTVIFIKTDMFGAIEYQSAPYLLHPGMNEITITDNNYTFLSFFPTEGAKSFLLDAVKIFQEKDTTTGSVTSDRYTSIATISSAYPNPIPSGTNLQTTISYQLERPADVRFIITDSRGSQIAQVTAPFTVAGMNETVLSFPSAGWYQAVMLVDGKPVRRSISIIAQ